VRCVDGSWWIGKISDIYEDDDNDDGGHGSGGEQIRFYRITYKDKDSNDNDEWFSRQEIKDLNLFAGKDKFSSKDFFLQNWGMLCKGHPVHDPDRARSTDQLSSSSPSSSAAAPVAAVAAAPTRRSSRKGTNRTLTNNSVTFLDARQFVWGTSDKERQSG